jgi:hypothetical protein
MLARGEIVLGILEILFVPMPDAWMRIRISDAGSGTNVYQEMKRCFEHHVS